MSLHDEIKKYLNELQELLTETTEQALIDKARALWGEDDVRYEVLEQLLEESYKFRTQSKPAEPEPPQQGENPITLQNKPIK
jgi:hypothetical protein